jgi:hypothetical protein
VSSLRRGSHSRSSPWGGVGRTPRTSTNWRSVAWRIDAYVAARITIAALTSRQVFTNSPAPHE